MMKKLTKHIAIVLAAVMCIGMLSACGGKTQGNAPADNAKTQSEKPADEKKSDAGKADEKKADAGKADEKKADDKKADEKKSDEKAEAKGPKLINVFSGTRYDYNYSSEHDYLYLTYGKYMGTFLDEKTRKEYPKLAKALDDFSARMEGSFDDSYGFIKNCAEDELSYENEYSTFPFFCEYEVNTLRADDRAVSFMVRDSEHSGGAHPNAYYFGVTYDTETGKELALEDVITDVDRLPQILDDVLHEEYPDAYFFDDDLKTYFEETIADNSDMISWVLDYEGINFIFSPYEIAPYAEGLLTAKLSYKDNADLIAAKYTEVPSEYSMYFAYSPSIPIDTDGDGEDEMLEIYAADYSSDSDFYESIVIRTDDEEYVEEGLWFYHYNAVLMHNSEGRNYLYIDEISNNDYHTLYVYDLSGDKCRKITEVDAVGFGYVDEPVTNNEDFYRFCGTADPAAFILDTRLDVLSTYRSPKHYSLGADGAPVVEDEYFLIPPYFTLTAHKEFEADKLDAAGNVDGSVTVKAGDTLLLLRTDGKTICDAALADGTEVRLQVDTTDWPQKINGLSVDDDFEGAMFAG